jgi:hypothetical protein
MQFDNLTNTAVFDTALILFDQQQQQQQQQQLGVGQEKRTRRLMVTSNIGI